METGPGGHHSPVGSFQRTGHLVPQQPKIAPVGKNLRSPRSTRSQPRALSLVSCLMRCPGSRNHVLAPTRLANAISIRPHTVRTTTPPCEKAAGRVGRSELGRIWP